MIPSAGRSSLMSQVLIPILDILGKGMKPLRVRRSTAGRAIASCRGPTVRMLLSKDGRDMDTSPVVSGWRCPVHEACGKKGYLFRRFRKAQGETRKDNGKRVTTAFGGSSARRGVSQDGLLLRLCKRQARCLALGMEGRRTLTSIPVEGYVHTCYNNSVTANIR